MELLSIMLIFRKTKELKIVFLANKDSLIYKTPQGKK